MIDGTPWWIPPKGKDTNQTPLQHLRFQRMRT